MSSLGQYAWSPRASLETEDGSRPVEANRAEEVLGLDLGPGSSQGSSSTRSSSLPPSPNLPGRRRFSRPQTRRGFLFGNHAVDAMGEDSSSSDLSFSSATRAYAGDDDDWETVDNGRPVARRNMGDH